MGLGTIYYMHMDTRKGANLSYIQVETDFVQRGLILHRNILMLWMLQQEALTYDSIET